MTYTLVEKRDGNKDRRQCWNVLLNGENIGKIEHYPNRWNQDNPYVATSDDGQIGRFATPYAAKIAIIKECEKNGAKAASKKRIKAEFLPKGDDSDFFPTPGKLAGQMFEMLDTGRSRIAFELNTILEPSAGKGDLANAFRAFAKSKSRYGENVEIDCIEYDRNLQYLLRGKGERLIHDDFLTFDSRKKYDAVIMNPPFSQGDKHLLKAIELQKDGGQIVCLLNAETLRNQCTNTRYLLGQKLEKLNAKIRFVKGAFAAAERKTGVEIAIVYINIPERKENHSDIYERMIKAHGIEFDNVNGCESLASANPIENLLQTFKVEVDATLEFFRQYNALVPYIRVSDDDSAPPMVKLCIAKGRYEEKCGFVHTSDVNIYMRTVRMKYWNKLFDNDALMNKFTSNILESYQKRVESLADYDFTEFNIMRVLDDMNLELNAGVEESIMNLFEKLSAEHSWYPECTQNRHYFNGWKTNKAHMVGMKSIIPTYGCYASYQLNGALDEYKCVETLADLEKALNYLNSGNTIDIMGIDLRGAIRTANINGLTRNICCKYFTVTFYKKGTCHIKFHPETAALIERLNIFAAQKRGWLPPYYGKVRYEDMAQEAKDVIDSFQGKEAYERVLTQPDMYFVDTGAMRLLGAGA